MCWCAVKKLLTHSLIFQQRWQQSAFSTAAFQLELSLLQMLGQHCWLVANNYPDSVTMQICNVLFHVNCPVIQRLTHSYLFFLEMTNQHVQSVTLYWQWSIYSWIVQNSGTSGWNTVLLLLWKTFLKASTIKLSLILLKTLIFIINCSACYLHFILAIKPCL